MTLERILQIIIARLGDNYRPEDENVLKEILNEKIFLASYISNREIDVEKEDKNLLLLSDEIITSTIQSYQLRGTEFAKNISELGSSSSFVDVNENLRENIIKNGKRVIF